MDCEPASWEEGEGFWNQLRRDAWDRHIPLSGGMDLTRHCNLRCAHCYLGPRNDDDFVFPGPELETSRILSILDEVTEAGCLFLLLTGGEVLLHPDFEQIYTHARRNGLYVTVFTNATLVDDRVVRLFREMPPKVVEVSLYGATAETYERVTGVAGSFAQCMDGIRRLHEGGVKLTLKTTVMTLNIHEVPAIRSFASELGVRLRTDPGLIPTLEGDRRPMDLRVSPQEAVRVELEVEGRVQEWAQTIEETRQENRTRDDSLYPCAAGRRAFYVDSCGILRPCQLTTGIEYDLKQGDFLAGWQEVIPRVSALCLPPNSDCVHCESMTLCRYCPPAFALETGSDRVPSPYLCATGRKRHEAVEAYIGKDLSDGESEE